MNKRELILVEGGLFSLSVLLSFVTFIVLLSVMIFAQSFTGEEMPFSSLLLGPFLLTIKFFFWLNIAWVGYKWKSKSLFIVAFFQVFFIVGVVFLIAAIICLAYFLEIGLLDPTFVNGIVSTPFIISMIIAFVWACFSCVYGLKNIFVGEKK